MRKIYLLFILLPLFSFAQKLQGQKLIDSLLVELPKMKEDTLKVNLLNELSTTYKDFDPKIGVKYSDKSFFLSKKLNWKKGISSSLTSKAINQIWIGNYEEAKSSFNQAIKFDPDRITFSKIYRGIGIIYFYQNNYPKALEYNNKALIIFEELKDNKGIASIISNNGNIYHELNNHKKAIEYYKKALLINTKIGNKISMINNLTNIGASYYKLNEDSEALVYYGKALKLAKSEGNKSMEANILGNLALIYKDLKKYDEAIESHEKANVINKDSGYEDDIAFNDGGIGRILLEKAKIEKDVNKKNDYLKKSYLKLNEYLIYLKENQELKDIATCFESISQIQKLQGNYKQALESHEQYVIYKDSVFNSDNKETIKNLEDKREIELRDKEIKINKLSLDAKEKQKWLFIAGIGFLLAIGGLLFYQSRKRKQINEKLQVLNENLDLKNIELDQANTAKTRFFGILNHDLRGPVANLIFFLQLQKESPEMLDAESIKRMQDKTMTGAENLLESMEDILQWSKSKMENFKPQPKKVFVSQLFDDTKKVFSGYLNIKIDYQNSDNIEIFTDDNYLKTIIRNLTSNAINILAEFVTSSLSTSLKTGSVEKQITWKAWQNNNQSFLSITDNGPGVDAEKLKVLFDESDLTSTKSGLGLHLIRDMAKAIDCEISVESRVGEGTTFTLKI